jgi:hypothetical protein
MPPHQDGKGLLLARLGKAAHEFLVVEILDASRLGDLTEIPDDGPELPGAHDLSPWRNVSSL